VNGYDMLQNALVVAFATAVLGWMVGGLRRETRRTFELLHGEIGSLRTEMREGIGSLRTEMREEIGGLHGELGSFRTETHDELRAVRSDLTQIALALGVHRRAGNE
jgi:hypothetical protein